MTISSKLLTLADYKAAQYAAIIGKGGTLTAGDWGAYAAAIDALPSGSGAYIPAQVLNMPFTAGDEPTGGTVWYVKPGGAGLKDGTSWSNAFATRQEAVNAASPGDQVRVWEGTYYLEQVQTPKVGVSEYYGFNDDGSWAKRQPFTNPSKHDAQFAANNYTNADVTFAAGQIVDGLWMQNVRNASGITHGSVIYLKNCTVMGCLGSTLGGGVYSTASGEIFNCIVANCSATDNGGGFYSSETGATITDCIAVSCDATRSDITLNYGGGGFFSLSPLYRCSAINCFTNSIAGGIYKYQGGIDGCFAINCSSIRRCGGIYIRETLAKNCMAINCSGVGNGGGIYSFDSLGIINCGTIACVGTNSIYLERVSRFYNNISYGGSIYFNSANYAYKIYNCASDNALTGVSGWDTNADVQNFLPLSTFPFAAAGVAPFDAAGAFYQSLPQGEEALAFIDRVVIPSLVNPRPHSTSPLIGAGYYEAGVTPDTDADGKARPLTPSIGAYEP